MIGHLLKPELEDLIEQRNFAALRQILAEFPAAEVAELLAALNAEHQAVLLRILPSQLAADVFEHLRLEDQEPLLRALGSEVVARILNEMDPDDRTAILEELPAAVTQRLLSLLSPKERQTSIALLGYPEDSIGRRMTPDYVAIQQQWTVTDVLAHLRRVGRNFETLDQLFVVDAMGKMIGVVKLSDLVTTELSQTVSDLLEPQVISLRADSDQETAVGVFKKYDLTVVPVVDSQGILVGVVTVDDVLDVAEKEATEDIHRVGAVEPLTTSLLRAPFRVLYGRRIIWLVLLIVVNIFSGAGIAYYETLIESAVALVFFLPLLMGSGGNSGAQAATLVIRSLALGEVRLRDYLKLLGRELGVALALGLTMAVAVFFLAWIRSGFYVAVAVSASMIVVVMIGSLIGMSLPFVLSRLRLDPAAASAPLVTSLADISGVLIYFSIAQFFLGLVPQ
jgi:magnesium transporter